MDFIFIIEAMIVGFVIASGYIYYNKTLLGSLVRRLLSEGCLNMQSAKTLSELGFAKNPFIKLSLRPGTSLCSIVSCADASFYEIGKRSGGKKEKKDFSAFRFYVSEEKYSKAERMYEDSGVTALAVLATAIIFLIVAVICYFTLPDLFDFAKATFN